MDSFRLVSSQTNVEDLLLIEEILHAGEVLAEVLGVHLRLIETNPGLNLVRLASEVEILRVVQQVALPQVGRLPQLTDLGPELFTPLGYGVRVIVPLLHQPRSHLADLSAPLTVPGEHHLEGLMSLDQRLHGIHIFTEL